MNLIHHSLFFVLCLVYGAASAQWQWLDNNGKKVFSDVAPPASVLDKDILRRPGASNASQPIQPAKPAAESAAAPRPKVLAPNGKDTELEKRKTQTEATEAAKKKADEQKQAGAKAENCDRAKRGLASLESGMRISQVNSQGEREFMTDEARTAEAQRVQGILASDCH